MDWRELAKGWKYLIAKVDFPDRAARESNSGPISQSAAPFPAKVTTTRKPGPISLTAAAYGASPRCT